MPLVRAAACDRLAHFSSLRREMSLPVNRDCIIIPSGLQQGEIGFIHNPVPPVLRLQIQIFLCNITIFGFVRSVFRPFSSYLFVKSAQILVLFPISKTPRLFYNSQHRKQRFETAQKLPGQTIRVELSGLNFPVRSICRRRVPDSPGRSRKQGNRKKGNRAQTAGKKERRKKGAGKPSPRLRHCGSRTGPKMRNTEVSGNV